MRRAVSRGMQLSLGIPLGLLLAFVIVVPGISQEAAEAPGDQGEAVEDELSDTGREMALSAGCDMSQNEVPMNVGEIDYMAGFGYPSVEEAVLGFSGYLKQNGLFVSKDDLRQAAAAARKDTIPVEVRLPGASLQVIDNGDGYIVGEVVLCA